MLTLNVSVEGEVVLTIKTHAGLKKSTTEWIFELASEALRGFSYEDEKTMTFEFLIDGECFATLSGVVKDGETLLRVTINAINSSIAE